ncbi:MAG: preprotein translocase subunit SecY [Planctomycetota bacterium]
MLRSFANVFRIPELARKVGVTILLLVIFRMGAVIPIPGANVDALRAQMRGLQGTVLGSVMSFGNMLSGGALEKASIFSLGIMPYISASIILQLLATVFPALKRLQEEGEAGRKKINQYTRYLTVLICLFQGILVLASYSKANIFYLGGPIYLIFGAITLTAGSLFLMWLGAQIDEFGIGNGISLIIMVGIVSDIPYAMNFVFEKWSLHPTQGEYGPVHLVVLLTLFIAVVIAIVAVHQSQRRIYFQQARHTRGRRVYGGQKVYMPLRVTQAGVIPIIFAQALIMIPAGIFAALKQTSESGGVTWKIYSFFANIFDSQGLIGMLFYMGLIIFFCYFWTAVMFNPVDIAKHQKEMGNFIPGFRPGRRTSEHLEAILTRITFVGSLFLAFVAVTPIVLADMFQVGQVVTRFYGGTGLLIAVSVALDLAQKIESQLLLRHYEGFGAKGRAF